MSCGEVTDCKIMTTKANEDDLLGGSGKSRGFCFIGFKRPAEAEHCVKKMRNTYLDTQKIAVEVARPVGDKEGVRPWSKYSYGSSAHKKLNKAVYEADEEAKRAAKKAKRDEKAREGQKWAEMKDENKLKLEEFLQLGKKKTKEQIMESSTPEKKKGKKNQVKGS